MKRILFTILLGALMLSSCDKVNIESHLSGSWELQTYLRNDIDETSSILISSYTETYSSDGTFSRSYMDGDGESVSETGDYTIDEENDQVYISGVSSISDFSDEHSTLSTSSIKVLVINDTEYSYSFENGGDKHEFRFVAK